VTAPPTERPIVYVVDDDESLRLAVASLLRAVELDVECFATAEEFMARGRSDQPSCLVLDVRLPGLSGLSIQDDLAGASIAIPIIFVTAHGDIAMTVRAMKAGAVEFLTKPFRDQDLLDAVQLALRRDRARLQQGQLQAELSASFNSLTAREKEIMQHVTAGLMNKQIAALLGLAEITVKIHRGNLMRKMNAHSVAELVRMAQSLEPLRGPHTHV
jgi:FixJ family two-component response regulator